MQPEVIEPLPEETQLGVNRAMTLEWDKTTIVKLITKDDFEAIGTYTTGLHVSPKNVRVVIARSNAERRLRNWYENKRERMAG